MAAPNRTRFCINQEGNRLTPVASSHLHKNHFPKETDADMQPFLFKSKTKTKSTNYYFKNHRSWGGLNTKVTQNNTNMTTSYKGCPRTGGKGARWEDRALGFLLRRAAAKPPHYRG